MSWHIMNNGFKSYVDIFSGLWPKLFYCIDYFPTYIFFLFDIFLFILFYYYSSYHCTIIFWI